MEQMEEEEEEEEKEEEKEEAKIQFRRWIADMSRLTPS